MGAKMKTILKVLNDAPPKDILTRKTTQTYIIMKAEGILPYRTHYTQIRDDQNNLVMVEIEKPHPPYVQQELGSALAKQSISRHMREFGEVENQTDKLYAGYSRSIKILLDHGFIKGKYVDKESRQPRRWFRSYYHLTDKGRQYLSKYP